jgi:hypothetical protein
MGLLGEEVALLAGTGRAETAAQVQRHHRRSGALEARVPGQVVQCRSPGATPKL